MLRTVQVQYDSTIRNKFLQNNVTIVLLVAIGTVCILFVVRASYHWVIRMMKRTAYWSLYHSFNVYTDPWTNVT